MRVVSIEERIEHLLPNVSQVGVDREIGFDMSAVVCAVMNHDPDILMIGELADRGTAALGATHCSDRSHGSDDDGGG